VVSSATVWPDSPHATVFVNDQSLVRSPTPASGDVGREGLLLDSDELRRTIDRLVDGDQKASHRNWAIALRLLAAHLDGLAFPEVATVIGISEDNLTRILHGEMKLQPSRHSRIDQLLQITLNLRRVITEDAVGDWFRTPIPALKDLTPLEAVRKRKVDAVARIVESYFDPSYA
jgi:hypothetical protein